MKRVDLFGMAIEALSGAPLVVLREHDEPHRLLPILVGSPEAAAIVRAISGGAQPRPLTHDLMATLMQRLDGHLDAVEVTGVRDGALLAHLAVHGPTGDQRVDTRPSDAIALAVRLGAPLFVAETVLEEAGTLPDVELDEAAIDRAVDEFRSFLDDVEPSQFTDDDARGSEPPPGGADSA